MSNSPDVFQGILNPTNIISTGLIKDRLCPFSLGYSLLLYLFIRKVFFLIAVLGSPFFQISIMLLILGFQSILMGLIAELLPRPYHESQSKPTFKVRHALGKKQ